MAVCASCREENPDRARFCLACGAPLAAAPATSVPVPDEERKVVTALFTDIVGSTASAEQLDPEDVRARLSPYYARLRAELERFGGTVEKFIGDAVVALFGAPDAHEDDPERAVRAAFAIRRAVAELNEGDAWLDLHIRTAVNTGEALVVVGARASEGEGMAAGDVMNTAARLQSAAPVDGVAVGEQTYRATAHAIEYREGEPIQAKGRVWIALHAKEESPQRAARAGLVGRSHESESLWRVWERVRAEEHPAVATVVGSPGIGKSRLLREFTERVPPEGAVHSGRCLSYGEGITYWPMSEIVKDTAGILQSDDADAGSRKLGLLLDRLPTSDEDELRTIAAALANLIGVPCTPRGTYSATEISQAELHWGIRRLLELLAAGRPLVLMVEDVHWAEPTLLELLHFIVEGPGSPLLVLCSARPELLDAGPAIVTGNGFRHVVSLEALSRAESETLLAELAGGDGLPPQIARVLLENAGGNPLFIEELVRMLADEGVLDGAATTELESIPVPSSLQALIGSRLDRLPFSEKRLAQHAAVVGGVFWSGAVGHLTEANAGLEQGLSELERRDFVVSHAESSVAGEREYSFKHILLRDVAYARLPKRRRVQLHARFADWVAALPGGEDELVEIVAYHLEQACRIAREIAHTEEPPPVVEAVDALRRAAEKAERREGLREARRFYERALELLGPEQLELGAWVRLGLGRMQASLGELRLAAEGLARVADEARLLGSSKLRCAALVALANTDWKRGQASEARRRLLEAETLARTADDFQLQIRAAYESAHVRSWFEGATDAAVGDVRRALAIAESIDDLPLRAEGHLRLGFLLSNVGKLEAAEAELHRCIGLAGDLGSHRDEARATFQLGFVKYYRGELREGERLALKALQWLERSGDTHLGIQNLRALAKFALARGDPHLAEQRLREALPAALEGGGWLVIELYRYLTEALVKQGRVDEARVLAEFAGRNLPEEDAYARAAALIAAATVAAAAGEEQAARDSFEEALSLLERHTLLTDLGEARVEYARVLRRFGDARGARNELELACRTVTAIGALGLLAEAERELAELGEGAGSSGPLAPA